VSRQPIRQRPPAEDDLQPTVAEEVRKLAQAAVGTAKQTPAAPHAGQPAAERGSYFSGQYSPVGPEVALARRLAALGVPDFLRPCVVKLVHVLRERGTEAALTAMHENPAVAERFAGPLRSLLAAIDREERSSPT
jgi:hypothetical protein